MFGEGDRIPRPWHPPRVRALHDPEHNETYVYAYDMRGACLGEVVTEEELGWIADGADESEAA